ncbi:NF038130 family PEP-CTERM protein [Alkalinema pantanalense CENA528]|uniref:NF038130 family PEP-CTERM protein n=1 Tax=Alkalinema pantanalense TaxID=1620705 RepID=UPI003D6FF97D
MNNCLRTITLTSLLAIGYSTIGLAPAQADSIQNTSIGGTAPTDYLLYDANGTNTFVNLNASLSSILSGDTTNPTGNIELAASSEKAGFDFSKTTTLNGTIGGRSISISSLTQSDWTAAYQGTTFGQYWFNQALTNNGFGSLVGTQTGNSFFNIFASNGGFQRFSDPNISYVNQNATGTISIGLAGHYNASSLFTQSIDQYLAKNPALPSSQKLALLGLKNQLSTSSNPIQASEIIKYTYNGVTNYGFSFKATQSGLVEKSDGISHSGNYEISIDGPPPIKVPEPGLALSLAGIGTWVALQRRRQSA